MKDPATIGIWLRKEGRLILVDSSSTQASPPQSLTARSPGFRLVAARVSKDQAPIAIADVQEQTRLAIWPPLHPQDVPMVLSTGPLGLELCIYHSDGKAKETFAAEPEVIQCDVALSVENGERWWVLGCAELPLDPAEAERPFFAAALVERSRLGTARDTAWPQRIIAAARALNPELRRVSSFLISTHADHRLGPALAERYVPSTAVVEITLSAMPTKSGTLQPRLGVVAPGGSLGDLLSNLSVFQLRRHGPACALPEELIFSCLGDQAHQVFQNSLSFNYFPPVRTGDVIGIVSRGARLKRCDGFQAGFSKHEALGLPAGVSVAMMVRHEQGFEPVEEDVVLMQTDRVRRLRRTLLSRLCNTHESGLLERVDAWVWARLVCIARDTVALVDDSTVARQVEVLLSERSRKHVRNPGYLLYPLAAPAELCGRCDSGKGLVEPYGSLAAWPDRDVLAGCSGAVSRRLAQV